MKTRVLAEARELVGHLIAQRDDIKRHVDSLDTPDALAWIGVVGLLDRAIDMANRAVCENEEGR